MTAALPSLSTSPARVKPHLRELPLRVGTRRSPLALVQTRAFLDRLVRFCPVLRQMNVFEEHAIQTTGDAVQNRRLAEIGGKGLFAKEIHEALADGRVDFAVHSLKDLETALPPGVVLACTLAREDARDAIILGGGCGAPDPERPYEALPRGALIGTRQRPPAGAAACTRARTCAPPRCAATWSAGSPKLAEGGLLGDPAGAGRPCAASASSTARASCWSRRRWCRRPARGSSALPCARTTRSCASCSPASKTRRPRRSRPPSGRCSARSTAPAAPRSAASPECCPATGCC